MRVCGSQDFQHLLAMQTDEVLPRSGLPAKMDIYVRLQLMTTSMACVFINVPNPVEAVIQRAPKTRIAALGIQNVSFQTGV